VIAVNLNAQLVGRHLSRAGQEEVAREASTKQERTLWQRMVASLSSGDDDRPGMFDVVAASVNILQDRLTRSRMAGDPPEITLLPVLSEFALMDFHRARECIEEGRRLVHENETTLRAWAGLPKVEPSVPSAPAQGEHAGEAPASQDAVGHDRQQQPGEQA
jgi:NTE family protein